MEKDMKEVAWWKERMGEGIRSAMWDAVLANWFM